MAGAIERIEQEIAALEEAIASLAAELYTGYSSYLSLLGKAVQQQLILAVYHISTQAYPDAFLQLSFSGRQQVQKALRRLAQQAPEQWRSLLEKNATIQFSYTPEGLLLQDDTENNPQALTLQIKNPEQLAEWQSNLEQAIAQTLQTLSTQSNRLLQQASIIPPQIPEAVLEVALKAEGAGETMPGAPNILSLMMEVENPQESENPNITPIVAINLRLSEIEFADSPVMSGRSQIRNLSSRLNNLRRDYQKKQRERTIAEAEAAWRRSWFEEDA